MSIVPCKFFARNECRFGDSCRFYHSRGSGNQNVGAGSLFGSRPMGATNFNTGVNQHQEVMNLTAKSQQNMDTMVELVKKDMAEWDYGKIWPFSSYGPVGGKPSVPGFDDISTEELRYRYLQNNKMPVDLSQELRSVQQARINYQQMAPATRNILERIILKGERISANLSSPDWGASSMSQTQTASIFGGSAPAYGSLSSASVGLQPQSNLFGTNTNSSVFGAPSQSWGGRIESMEGSQQQGSTLFMQPQISNNSGLFSNQPKPSLFGNIPTAPLQQSNIQPSLFGQTQPNQAFTQLQQQNLFQTQPSLEQNLLQTSQQSTALFSTPQPLASQQLQLSSSSSGVFGSSNSGLFGGINPVPSSTQSLFGGSKMSFTSPPQQSLFGAPPNQTSPSIFGAQQQQPTSLFPSSSVSNNSGISTDQKYVYSEESDLTQEELNAFKADIFTIENIPIRPPPKMYCSM